MKFEGFGQVMVGDKIIVNFKSGPNRPGIVDIEDQNKINVLIERGYKTLDVIIQPEVKVLEKTDESVNKAFDKQLKKNEEVRKKKADKK
jgi:hypothetical protein